MPTAAELLNESLIAFTGAIGEALTVCSYGLIVGDAYTPFAPDEDEGCGEDDDSEEDACTQAWVRVMGVGLTRGQPSMAADDCSASMTLDLEVGVLRCLGIPEGGEAPTASDMLAAAAQAMTDMNDIYCAAVACDAFDRVSVGSWTPEPYQGGQYGGSWVITVEGPMGDL